MNLLQSRFSNSQVLRSQASSIMPTLASAEDETLDKRGAISPGHES